MTNPKLFPLSKRLDRSVVLVIVLGITAGISFVLLRPMDEASVISGSGADPQRTPVPRAAPPNHRLSALPPPDTSHLSPKLQVQTGPDAHDRLQAEVARLVAEHGEEKAATLLAANASGDRPRGRAVMEALTATWAADDPVAASNWLLQHTGPNASTENPLAPELWEAAVSGYIEGVADDDAETAAMLAGLLPAQTRLPAYNPNNRQPRADRDTRTDTDLLSPSVDEVPHERDGASDDASSSTPAQEQIPTDTNNPAIPAEEQSPSSGRDPRFPGDPGFPGDPDYLTPR